MRHARANAFLFLELGFGHHANDSSFFPLVCATPIAPKQARR